MASNVTEFVGTFFLVLTIGLTAVGQVSLAPLAIGATLMVMVFMGGHVSGGHYNPAVSFAAMLRGKLEGSKFGQYLVVQILGAISASVTVLIITGHTFAPAPASEASLIGVLLVEFLYTTALALVVLSVTTAEGTKGNSFYGLAIGFTIVVAAFSGGPISGGAFNPAVGIGPILVNAVAGGGSLGDLWIYLVAPFSGGAVASVLFKIQNPKG